MSEAVAFSVVFIFLQLQPKMSYKGSPPDSGGTGEGEAPSSVSPMKHLQMYKVDTISWANQGVQRTEGSPSVVKQLSQCPMDIQRSGTEMVEDPVGLLL